MAYRQPAGHSASFVRTSQQRLGATGLSATWNTIFLRIVMRPHDPWTDWGGYYAPFIISDFSSNTNTIYIYFYRGYWSTSLNWWFRVAGNNADGEYRFNSNASGDERIGLPGVMAFTMIYNGSQLATYLNGTRLTTRNVSGTWAPTNYTLNIGAGYNNGNPWNGRIDDVILTDTIPSELSSLPQEYEELILTAEAFCEKYGITPRHMWTFENASNLGLDTGNPGGWNLTAYNNPTQGDPLCGELVDETTPIIEYPQAIVMGAKLRIPRMRAKLRSEI